MADDERSNTGSSTEEEDGKSTCVGRDKDSNVSLDSDTEYDTSGSDEELEDWIEYVKRSTRESTKKKKHEDNQYFMLARDTTGFEIEICYKQRGKMDEQSSNVESRPSTTTASRSIGRPKKRYEDDLNDFVMSEETEESTGCDLRNGDTWTRNWKNTKHGKMPRIHNIQSVKIT